MHSFEFNFIYINIQQLTVELSLEVFVIKLFVTSMKYRIVFDLHKTFSIRQRSSFERTVYNTCVSCNFFERFVKKRLTQERLWGLL